MSVFTIPTITKIVGMHPPIQPPDASAIFRAGENISFRDLLASFASLGIERGDTLVLHSETTTIGALGEIKEKRAFADAILLAAKLTLGEEGTLIVPTFTYSFTRKLPFDPRAAKPTIGILPERIVEWPGAIRSNNPMFSYTAMGHHAEDWMQSDIFQCFGPESINAKLIQGNCKFCFFGSQGLQMITAVHSVEFELSVPYRAQIWVEGDVCVNDNLIRLRQSFFARKLELSLVADFSRLESQLRASHLLKSAKLGWGTVSVATAEDIRLAAKQGYSRDPAFLVRKAE